MCTLRCGAAQQSVYDEFTGRLSEKRFFANLAQYDDGEGTPAETWEYTYDAFDREVEVTRTNANGSTSVEQTYNARGQLVQITASEGTISYTYDNLGRRTSVIIGTLADPQRVTSYTYDALGRLATVVEDLIPASTNDDLLTTTYQYDLVGNLQRTDLLNGVIEHYEYDALNRLDKLTHYAPDETPENLADNDKIAEFDYDVRDDGKRSGVTETYYHTETPQTVRIDWEYDNAGRLIEEVFDHYDDDLDRTTYFTYDLVGNRLEQQIDKENDETIDETTSYTYDVNDRLLTESADLDGNETVDRTTTYGYDHTQQTSKTVVENSQTTSSTAFSYNLQGRLETVTVTSFTSGVPSRIERTTYGYNAAGIKTSSLLEVDSDADETFEERKLVEYLNDPRNYTGYSQVLRETHIDVDTEAITKTIDYTIGLDEIAQTTTEFDSEGEITDQETLVFGHDGHTSVRMLTDLQGVLQQHYSYEAYGTLLAIFNGVGSFVSANAKDALTTQLNHGEPFDVNTKLGYNRARWTDLSTGRFLGLDPFYGNTFDPQSFHKYLLVHADPTNRLDPTGLFSLIGMGMANSSAGYLQSNHSFAVSAAARTGLFALRALANIGSFAIRVAIVASINHTLTQFGQRTEPLTNDKLRNDYQYALLTKAAYRSENPYAVREGWAFERNFDDDSIGYRAVLFRNDAKREMVLSFAGTDDHRDILTDIYQGLGGRDGQYEKAIEDARWVVEHFGGNYNIRFTGHSLGGGLASAAALVTNRPATTFNAAGLHPWTVGRHNASLFGGAELIDAYRVRGEALSSYQDGGLFQLGAAAFLAGAIPGWGAAIFTVGALGYLMPDGVGTPYWLDPPGMTWTSVEGHFMDRVLAAMESRLNQ